MAKFHTYTHTGAHSDTREYDAEAFKEVHFYSTPLLIKEKKCTYGKMPNNDLCRREKQRVYSGMLPVLKMYCTLQTD